MFETVPYEETTIRGIAGAMGRSTGLVFANFPDKESLWRAAMGTPPPIDSALTRAAPHLLESLEALIDQRAAGARDDDEHLWLQAKRAIDAARGPGPGVGAASALRAQDQPGRRLNRFGAHVAAEVETRRDLPLWKEIMEPIYALCGQLMAYAERKATEAEVYEAAVLAGATVAQVAIHGAADVPYRTVPDGPAKSRPARRKSPATNGPASAP